MCCLKESWHLPGWCELLRLAKARCLNARTERMCMHTEKELPLQIPFFFSFLF